MNADADVQRCLGISNREGAWYSDPGVLTQGSMVQKSKTSSEGDQLREESHALHAAIVEEALDCIVTIDEEGCILEFNAAAEQTFGFRRSDVLGRPMVDLIIPEELRARHLEGLRRYLETGEARILRKRLEMTALRADGSSFPIELTVVPTVVGRKTFFTAYVRDITERRATAEALQLIEARYRHLADAGIIGIIVTDISGNVHEANDEFLRMVGYTREEFEAGRVRWDQMTPQEWRYMAEVALAQLAKDGVVRPFHKEYIRKDGTRVPALVGMAALDETGSDRAQRVIGFALDLTEQRLAEQGKAEAAQSAVLALREREQAEGALRHAEEQLRQSQKMESIGTLAGAVAHDFNNLLSVILSYAQLLQQDLEIADPMREDLEQIVAAGRSANDLTRQLLAFSRQQMLAPRVVDLNRVVEEMTPMLKRLIGEDVDFRLGLGESVGNIFVDPGQIEQVLLNLVVNARDAMPRGGELSIETWGGELDPEYAAHLEVKPGEYVMLKVSDTGVGMDGDTRLRIFEPFFTTKGTGKGTGLGLSTVFGIVKQSGGAISVLSQPGEGSTFKVFFPRDESPATEDKTSARPATGARGSETILLVEDDAQLRKLAITILSRQGYRVLDAPSGDDALALAETHAGEIDLLLTDVVMPKMSGRELWEQLHARHPTLKVVFMSGYTDDAVAHHGIVPSEYTFVQKPLLPDPLLEIVRGVLDTA